jgi:hypothetical protein
MTLWLHQPSTSLRLHPPLSRRVAQRLLQRCEVQLKPALQRYLTTLLSSPSSDSPLRPHALDVIFQVHGPNTLLLE